MFETYKDMIKKQQMLDRLTGTAWCSVIDEYIELGKKIGAMEAAFADLIEITCNAVDKVEAAQRDTYALRCEYDNIRKAVEYVRDTASGAKSA